MTELLPLLGPVGGLAALLSAIAVLIKVGPQRTDVKIGTADKVMLGQDRFIDQLQEDVDRANARVDALADEVDQLRKELRAVTDERDELHRENVELRRRVKNLEDEVQSLRRRRA